jgi:hypothetical protein
MPRRFCKTRFLQNFELFLANWALQYGYQNNAEFFYADFEAVEKNAKNVVSKSYRATKLAKLELVIFCSNTLPKLLANNFIWLHFFQLFQFST